VTDQDLRARSAAEARGLRAFFEVHGRQPDDVGSWPANIMADLHRHRIPAQDRRRIYDQAADTAVTLIRSSSPLAWGES
jgi:hypothetical protein